MREGYLHSVEAWEKEVAEHKEEKGKEILRRNSTFSKMKFLILTGRKEKNIMLKNEERTNPNKSEQKLKKEKKNTKKKRKQIS
jgi:hypothetical protein